MSIREPSRARGLAAGLAGGLAAGTVWWAVEIAVNWALGGVVPAPFARTVLELDLAAGAVGGLVVAAALGFTPAGATAPGLALGLTIVVYGLLRVFEPPGMMAEALFVVVGTLAVVAGTWLAGSERRGAATFLQLTLMATLATVLGTASIGQVESTYFAFGEPTGAKLVLLLAALPLVGVLADRVLAIVLRDDRLRLGLEVVAAGLAALLLGHPMRTAPLDDAAIVTAPPPPPGTPDVILVSLDTTRADHMSTYGYGRDTSPNLTALAQDALNFTDARSPAQWTVPGHASMFTGMYPSRHGAHYAGEWGAGPLIAGRRRVFPLGDDKTTLAEMLRDRGYSTAGFVANFANLDRAFGFAQGFGHYEDAPGLLLRPIPHVVRLVQQFVPSFGKKPFRSAQDIGAAAVGWMDRAPAGRPVFLFLNWLEPHHWLAVPPYDHWSREIPDWKRWARKGLFTHKIPVRLSPVARDFIRANYDGQIALMDAALGRLVAELKARGRYENTLLIVTADHGELLGEHDEVGHGGRMMYEGLLHIPMVVKLPGPDHPRGVVADPVQLVDLVPTVLSALGAPIPADVQGQPLGHVTHPIFAEEDVNPEFVAHYGAVYDRALRVLYDGPYKLIRSSRGERLLFDLATDRDEEHDLASAEPDRVAEMERRLEATMASMPMPRAAAATAAQ